MANHEKHIDDLLKAALGEYAEMPPAGAWDDMQTRLANADGKEHIDDVFQDSLGKYTEAPPAAAWVDMEKRLEEKKRRRRPLVWFWYAAAVTGVLLLAYMFLDKRESDTAFRGKGATEQIATMPAMPADNTQGNAATATAQQDDAADEFKNVPAQEEGSKQEAAHVTVAEAPAKQSDIITPQPQQKEMTEQKHAPVAKEENREPKVKDTPKKEQKITVQGSVPPEDKEAVTQQKDEPEEVDDIAHAIRKRGPGTVMNVIRSRYADSMAKVEKELARLAEERKAKKEEKERAQPPVVVAADPEKTVRKEPKTPVADIDPLARGAIDKTEQNLLAKQDAIPGSGIKKPIDELRFEDSDSFIGPRQDKNTYANASVAVDDSLPEDFVRVRKPIKFDFFMKLGYETGLSQYKANKYVFAPMLQANLSDRFSLIFQPAFKMGNAHLVLRPTDNASGTIGAGTYQADKKEMSYYQIESSYMDSIKSYTTGHNAQGIIFDSVRATYYYQESYDSIVISHNLNSSRVFEADLPLMLNYKVTKALSVYGGPVVTFSNMLQIDEQRDKYKGATRRDTISYAVSEASEAPGATPIREVFTYSGKEISEYVPAPYANPSVNKVRLGYMLGLSYNYKRFTADLSVQQNLSRLNYIPNVSIRNIYLQPYTRFMLGYRLNNRKK